MPDASQACRHNSFSEEARAVLREKPPSMKLVAFVLYQHKGLTVQQLQEQSLLPERTIRYALSELQDDELVGAYTTLQNVRKNIYHWSRHPVDEDSR